RHRLLRRRRARVGYCYSADPAVAGEAVGFADGPTTRTTVITRLVRNCALGRVIQYSRDGSVNHNCRGVLDTPPSRSMTGEFVEATALTARACPPISSSPV